MLDLDEADVPLKATIATIIIHISTGDEDAARFSGIEKLVVVSLSHITWKAKCRVRDMGSADHSGGPDSNVDTEIDPVSMSRNAAVTCGQDCMQSTLRDSTACSAASAA